MASKIRMLALDLDGTLTNSSKQITPRTKVALDAAMDAGVTVVLASGRPTVGVEPVAAELGLEKRGGCILSYNGGRIVDCKTQKVLYEVPFPHAVIPDVCAFAREQDVAVLSYDAASVVCERPADVWAQREAAINRIPIRGVENLAKFLDYPVCKLLIALPPERMAAVEPLARARFAGRIDVFRSCDFFIELVPVGVAKDRSLAALMVRAGLEKENLMAVGDAMNDLPMIRYAGVGVAMANGDPAVRAEADYVTAADNDHDGVAEAIEKFILQD
jgi:Cof subfamily protein (haloacid dehalogenase superfamily)